MPAGSSIHACTAGGVSTTNEHWSKVRAELLDFQGGPNRTCDYYPCHHDGQDCGLCFCPLYPCLDERLGKMIISNKGTEVWSCESCFWPHRADVAAELAAKVPPSETPPLPSELQAIKREVEVKHPVSARPIMVVGATSGAGKTLTAAALCRIFSDMGYNVAPFKSQNMSLNSMVTPDGSEISRAQALQAAAARTRPDAHMNPILLKPKKDDVSQVIVEGRPYKDMNVPSYYGEFAPTEGVAIIEKAWDHLRRTRDVVVIEGAGSPAEINIADVEIANMRTAEIAQAPCLLVVNLEWGGGFAYAYGTIALLSPQRRAMIKGVILNNMHGDPSCLKEGIVELEKRTGVPVLGVVPHLDHILPDEDSQDISSRGLGSTRVGVIRLPRISNFTDFDALALDGATVDFIEDPRQLREVDAIIVPGTKNTVADLLWLRDQGFASVISELRGKVPILGICGGYQMLGREVRDPHGLEGGAGKTWEGLGLLEVSTSFDSYDKTTVQATGRLASGEGAVRGYEIHMGKSKSGEAPLFMIDRGGREEGEGAISPDGMVMGTYLHGLFDLPSFRTKFLSRAGKEGSKNHALDYHDELEYGLDALADLMKKSLDMDLLTSILKEGLP